jgi:hypothetical protein
MAYVDMVIGARAVGPADDGGDGMNRYLYSGDGASTWKRGQLLKLSSGVVASVITHASAGTPAAAEVDTDDMPAAAGTYFIAMEDQDTVTSGLVPVRKITPDTIFEGPILNTTTDSLPTAPESIVGTSYVLYQNATGKWSVDKDQTDKPVVKITAVQGQFSPVVAPSWQKLGYADHDSDGVAETLYNIVRFKFLATVVGA